MLYRLSGVVSLDDLRRFYGSLFSSLTAILSRLEILMAGDKAALAVTPDVLDPFRSHVLVPLASLCVEMQLPVSLSYVERIQSILNHDRDLKIEQLRSWAIGLQERLEDEMKSELLFQLPRERVRFYLYNERIPAAIDGPLDSCIPEMIAAGRCLGYGEGTAAVFHLMRCVDKGLRLVADSLEIVYENSNWAVLRSLFVN